MSRYFWERRDIIYMILLRQNPNKISEKDPSQGLQNVIKYSLLLHSYLKHTDLKSSTTFGTTIILVKKIAHAINLNTCINY